MSEPSRYITKLKIENFQSHEDLEINLSPGINLLVGTSNAGKSAILRALNFLLHNQPRNRDKFLRKGADEARVTAWYSDGYKVCRFKGESSNGVMITDPDGNEEIHDKIGDKTPESAIKAMGYPPIYGDGKPLSYADQMEPLFIVSETPTTLPRLISELTGIDDIEKAGQECAKQARAAKKSHNESTKRLEELENRLAKFADLEKKKQIQSSMREKIDKGDAYFEKRKQAEIIYKEHKSISEQIENASGDLKMYDAVKVHEKDVLDMVSDFEITEEKRQIVSEYTDIVHVLSETCEQLEIYSGINCEDLLSASEKMLKGLEKTDIMRNLLDEHAKIVKDMEDNESRASTLAKQLSKEESDHEELVKKLTDEGVLCPECGQPVPVGAK